MPRRATIRALLVLVGAIALLLAGSALPGHALLPMTPDSFPAWGAGADPDLLLEHGHPNRSMSDVLHLLVPGLRVTLEAVHRGELPLWDPSQALGLPHVDQVHYGVFYPPAWLPLLLGLQGLALMAAAHLLAAGAGMWLYLRALQRSAPAALAGAAAFAFSAWMLARLQAFPVAGALVWLPWILWGLERGASGGGWRPRLVAALAVALSVFASFPQITLWVIAVAVFIELVRAAASVRRVKQALGPLLAAGVTIALGLGLAAPQLLPTAEYLSTESLRGEQTLESALADQLEWPMLWMLLSPDHYSAAHINRPDVPHPLAVMDIAQAKRPVALNRAEVSMGIGVMGLLLAILAMLYGRSWRTRAHMFVVLGVFALLLLPRVMSESWSALPLLHYGSPKRLLALSTFSLAVLASGGVDLARTRRVAVTATGWALAVAALVGLILLRISIPPADTLEEVESWAGDLAVAMGQEGLSPSQVFQIIPRGIFEGASEAAAGSATLGLLVALGAVLLFRPKRLATQEGWSTRAQRTPWLVTGLIFVELVLGGRNLLRAAPVSEEADSANLQFQIPELAKELRALGGDDPVPVRVGRVGNSPAYLRPNLPGMFGLHDVQCYAPMAPRRVTELLGALSPGIVLSGSSLGGFGTLDALESPLLDMLGVAGVITDQPFVPDGYEQVATVGHVHVLRNTEALPRFHMVHDFGVIQGREHRLTFLSSSSFDPRNECVFSEPPDLAQLAAPADVPQDETGEPEAEAVAEPEAEAEAEPEAEAEAETDATGLDASEPVERRVEVSSYAPGRITLQVGEGLSGLLVVTETWHPGWRARVGSSEVPVWVANHAVMAIPIAPRGETEVVLTFEHPALMRGFLVAAVCAVLVLVLALWPRRRPKLESPF